MFGPSLFGGGDPFAMMDQHFRQMEASMFGSFGMPPFPSMQQQQQQRLPRQSSSRTPGVTIEECGSDEESHPVASGQQPVVDEPSDEEDPHQNNRRVRRARHHSPPQQQQQQQMAMPGFGGGGLFGSLFGGFPDLSSMASMPGGTGFSYSTSSFQSSGPNGIQYQATNSSRQGPNGVRESHAAFHDGRTGRRDVKISRGLKDRERILHRIRDATGRENAEEILNGMSQDEVDRFDREWQEQAERNLMWGNGRRGPSLGYSQQQQQQSRPALASGAANGQSPAGYGGTSAYAGTNGVGGSMSNGYAPAASPAYARSASTGAGGYGTGGYGTGGYGTGGYGTGAGHTARSYAPPNVGAHSGSSTRRY